MEQNRVVVMLDEEISRLREVRTILQSLLVTEARVAPLLIAAAAEPEPATTEAATAEVASTPSVVRHISRRGMATGTRGPRRAKQVAAAPPGPLGAAIPKAPVVVSREALQAAKPVVAPAPPASALEGTLESWVRSFKQTASVS